MYTILDSGFRGPKGELLNPGLDDYVSFFKEQLPEGLHKME